MSIYEDMISAGYSPLPKATREGRVHESASSNGDILISRVDSDLLETEGVYNVGEDGRMHVTVREVIPELSYTPVQSVIEQKQLLKQTEEKHTLEDNIKYTSEEVDIFNIPKKHFLLSSETGEVYLKPDGFTEKEDFIVLFFPTEQALTFRPSLSARFIGAYDVDSGEQIIHHLFYSGIIFQLPDSERIAIIFHKIAIETNY